ncbi:MAG: hypothetical protein OXI96_06145 [Acidimicrobiaceae bacterium]|nr:hypothetical protein [Acidimicrobiaceae bacterium]
MASCDAIGLSVMSRCHNRVVRTCVLTVLVMVFGSCGSSDSNVDGPLSQPSFDENSMSQSPDPSLSSETTHQSQATETTIFELPQPSQNVTPPTTTEPPPQTGTTVAPTTTETQKIEYATFRDGSAPQWPFRGLVQLWPSQTSNTGDRLKPSWVLRYWSWDVSAETYPQVVLPDLRVDCLGKVALIVHAERGIEVGGPPGTTNSMYWIPWGGLAQQVDAPSQELLQAQQSRPSNVTVNTEGDWVHIDTGSQMQSYAMRDPIRSAGSRWNVQARHDGEIFLVTVHPTHLPCYSGVTWMSLAATGEHVICGANSAATAFVAPSGFVSQQLVLPDPDTFGTYLSCAPQLNLEYMRFTEAPRSLVSSLHWQKLGMTPKNY